MKANRLFSRIAIVYSAVQSYGAYAQETTSLNFGYNFLKNDALIDLQFNRAAATDAESSYDIKFVRNRFVLNPAAEAHIGAGTETSPNNIILLANLYYKTALPKKTPADEWVNYFKINILSPELTSDKNFSVYQGYATVGLSFLPTYSKRSGLGDIQFSLGGYFNYGLSRVEGASSNTDVSRFKLDPSFHWYFGGVNHNASSPQAPPELDPDFFYRFGISTYLTQYLFLKQDERITDRKSPGFFNLDFSYRFVEHLKLTASFKQGRLEPLYTNVSAVSLGIALVN